MPLPPTIVVALHCSASGPQQWDRWKQYVPRDLTIKTPSLMGYAEGAWHEPARYGLDAEVAHVMRTMDAESGAVHLIGHSFGGAVALQCAIRHPRRFASVTLFEPVRFGCLRSSHSARQGAVDLAKDVELLVRTDRWADAARLFVAFWSGPDAWQAMSATSQARIAGSMPKVSSEFRALFSCDATSTDLVQLGVPITLMLGSQSPPVARQIAWQLAGAVPVCKVLEVQDAGHMAPITHAHAVAAAVVGQWLAGERTAAAMSAR